jgi:hypothetical protein
MRAGGSGVDVDGIGCDALETRFQSQYQLLLVRADAMATKNDDGQISETEEEATQAEKSPDTFIILTVSLAALAIVAAGLFWYFGVFAGSGGTTAR